MPGWTERYYPHFANLYRYIISFINKPLHPYCLPKLFFTKKLTGLSSILSFFTKTKYT